MNRERIVELRGILQAMADRSRANDKKSAEHFYAGAAEAYQQSVNHLTTLLEICEVCDGKGEAPTLNGIHRCERCKGTGKHTEKTT